MRWAFAGPTRHSHGMTRYQHYPFTARRVASQSPFPWLVKRKSKLPFPAPLLQWCKQPTDFCNRLIDLIEHLASLFQHYAQIDDGGHRSLSRSVAAWRGD